MSELKILTEQRDELLAKIRAIEETCEGIENENNAKRVQELNLEQAKLSAEKNMLSGQLSAVQKKLTDIGNEIVVLSGTGIDRILEAIKTQRWYFFKDKPKVLMDRDTGLLWANLDYFPYIKNNNDRYVSSEICDIISSFDFDGITGFRVPDCYEFWNIICEKLFPFNEGDNYRIKKACWWFVYYNNSIQAKDTDHNGATNNITTGSDSLAYLIPCSDYLVNNSDYKNNVSSNNSVYTEKERLQFTLDLFVQNELMPIFDDDEITQLYKKIYFEKPELMKELQKLQTQIEELQTVTLLSSEFDYTALLTKYDISAIDASVIKYYEAVQQWTNDLMDKLDFYEQEKEAVIRDFNIIGLKLSKKYEANINLTKEENQLLEERQRYFRKEFSLGMNSVKSKLLAVKRQADTLERRIDEIDDGEDSIHALAVLEREERASFSFVAENTAKIIRNALKKIEYFEAHHQFVISAVEVWERWSEDYRVFKTSRREDLKGICEEDGIEEGVWSPWYQDWQKLRFAVEQKLQPIIERGLKGEIACDSEEEKGTIERIIDILEEYKKSIDRFYLEERKGIFQKYVFQSGGDLQDKFETEGSLYRYAALFQSSLQEVIFNCKNAEDRVFILNWANSLLDIQIDEILEFVADKDLQKISQAILTEFAALKQKNYEVYLTDAKAYGEEKARREKQYNSLIYKMRKDLMA